MELQGSFGMFLDISDRSRMDKATVVFFDIRVSIIDCLGGGFKYFLFSPLPAEMIHFD